MADAVAMKKARLEPTEAFLLAKLSIGQAIRPGRLFPGGDAWLDPRTQLDAGGLWGRLGRDKRLVSSRLLSGWGVLVLIVALMGGLKAYARWLLMVAPMALFFGAVTWWSADRQTGVMAALTLLVLVSVFFAFFHVCAPEDLGNALVKIGLPYAVAFIFSTSLQFVPVIGRKAKSVLDAQRSRGIPLEPGWKALRHYPAFLGPLLIQAFRLAEELAEAMEARGFGCNGRTFLKDYCLKLFDWFVLGAGLVLLAAWIWWQH